MASVGPSGDDGITEINVTPFVDITLVLLVIFMVTAKLMSPAALPLDLPQAATGGETQTMLVVGVDAQGHMTADGEALTDDAALRVLAARRLAEVPELRTVIQASSRASHGAVVHVLDELRIAGVAQACAALCLDQGDAGTAIAVLRGVVQSLPLDSALTEALMRAHVADGDRAGAERVYREHATALAQADLGDPDDSPADRLFIAKP